MNREQNLYDRIHYYPGLNRYAAMDGYGRSAKVIGFFDSLDEAVKARNEHEGGTL